MGVVNDIMESIHNIMSVHQCNNCMCKMGVFYSLMGLFPKTCRLQILLEAAILNYLESERYRKC